MTRMSRKHLVSVIVLILALTMVPMAGARPVEGSQVVHQADGGWFGVALKWIEDLAGVHRPVPGRHHGHSGSQSLQKDGSGTNSSTGGSCIDPQGNPRPWCM